ncbi:unnamed protein product [Mytilus edulis]|uniref:Uncharacterized protein n=1 Tax=Mytilus edulis TaxID=6550 RepID=A0A8S3UGP0_MYTED|nr:unnamed protein product [Mytilus edulis]
MLCITVTIVFLTYNLENIYARKIPVPCFFQVNCRCKKETDNSNVIIDCSKTNTTTIPDFPRNSYSVDLQHNRIQFINGEKFRFLTHLTVLDLSFNVIAGFNRNSFEYMKKLVVLKLNNNPLRFKGTSIPVDAFKPLRGLKHLGVKNIIPPIDRSSYHNIPDESLSDLKMLETVEVDILKADPFGQVYKSLNHLHTIDMGKCWFYQIASTTFRFVPYLKNLDIDISCSIRFLRNFHYDMSRLKSLTLRKLGTKFVIHDFPRIVCELMQTPIEILSFRNTFTEKTEDLSTTWNTLCYCLNSSRIKRLRLTENNFAGPISELWESPDSLRFLNLSTNKLNQFAVNLNKIRILILRDNLLGDFLQSNRYMTTNKSVLEYVDLSQNNIYKLNFRLFHGQPNLKHIMLGQNGLREVAFDLSRSLDLRFLDLSNNLITSLTERNMAMFDNIAKISNLTIKMYNNPLSCNCVTLPFLTWMTKTRVIFLHQRQYRCVLDDGPEVTLIAMKGIIHQQQKDCVSYSDILIGSTISVFTLIVLLLSALVYKYRWKLRYMFYLAKSKHYSYKASNEDGIDYSYHSFNCYD